MTASPLIPGVNAIMIGAGAAAPHIGVFKGALGWDVASQARLPREFCSQLWGIDAAAEVTALSPPGVSHGAVHVLVFPEIAVPIATEPPPRSYRLRHLNMYVRDMAEARRRVEAAGAIWKAEVRFDITALDGTVQTVHQARVGLSDGAGLVFVIPSIARWTATWSLSPAAFATEITSIVAGIPDVDASKAFWGPDGLGLEIRYDITSANAKLNELSGLEPDAVTRLAFGWGQSTARVELLGRGPDAYAHIPSIDLMRTRRPGRSTAEVGWVVEVAAFEAALQRMTERGGRILCAPIHGDGAMYRGRVATVEAPEGSLLTVVEALPR